MRDTIVKGLLWFSAIGCGLMGGVYFAFSTFVMTALNRLAPAQGIAAMNSISVTIVHSLFMPLFMGTTLSSLALVAMGLLRRTDPGAMWMINGGIVYVVGMFLCTMIYNVPLNDALAAVDPTSSAGETLWARYVTDWTFWNHVRTVASIAAAVLLTLAMGAWRVKS
jgi:uncharacterized membrane protein